MSPKRVTPQQDQERRSGLALCQAFAAVNWPCARVTEDLGEDYLVRIYSDGCYSGLSFFVQLKSTTDFDKHPAPNDSVSYAIPIKDLLHWEDSNPPVVLVLWDVGQGSGIWMTVRDAIKWLGASKPTWRRKHLPRATRKGKRATVAVHFPKSQRLDEPGLAKLRRVVGMAALPSISAGKDLHFKATLTFSDTDEARAKAAELEKAVAEGESVDIPSQYVDSIVFSEWWERIFGPIGAHAVDISLGPTTSDVVVPFAFAAFSTSGRSAEIPYLELRVISKGTKQATLSNRAQDGPLEIELKVDLNSTSYSGTITPRVHRQGSLATLVQTVSLLRCLGEGCDIKLTFLRTPEAGHLVETIPPRAELVPSAAFIAILDDLQMIQQRFALSFRLGLDISAADRATARWVAEVVRSGVRVHHGTCSVPVDRALGGQLLRSSPTAGRMRISGPSQELSSVPLLGQVLPLGPSNVRATGMLQIEELGASLAKAGNNDVALTLIEAEIVQEFSLFLPNLPATIPLEHDTP